MMDLENATDATGKAPECIWGLGGQAYDRISFGISDALAHAAQRLRPSEDERVLDVGTGTGWSARNVHRYGARVTAVDPSPGMLEAATALSGHLRPAIEFIEAPAENLPFPDASFDAVISTFGVMFTAKPEAAAVELARVCRPGARLVLAVWPAEGSVAEFFALIARHSLAPPPDPSPLAWGDPQQLQAWLGEHFELHFEQGINHAYYDDVEQIWQEFATGFGPFRNTLDNLDLQARAMLRNEYEDFHLRYLTPAGKLDIQRNYWLVVGQRRS